MNFSIPKTVSANIDQFSGRAWLLQIIQEWFEHSSEQIFLLTSGPGTAYSAKTPT
jgi:hypothetical protein